jgi:hypothetical protein
MPTAKSRVEKMELWRSSFDTTVLLKRLNDHALGQGSVEMTRSQIDAAKILLAKTVPDLKQVELSGNPDNPVVVQTIRREIVENPDN